MEIKLIQLHDRRGTDQKNALSEQYLVPIGAYIATVRMARKEKQGMHNVQAQSHNKIA
jgi:hypothetical protein